MPVDSASFVFVIALAGVVNGLGIVRWLTGLTEYLKLGPATQIAHYWVFFLASCFQFLLHILFWWSLWSMRGSATINFLSFLYLLSGPILLFVGTAVLMPTVHNDKIDLKTHYFAVRPSFSVVLILVWLWALFASPLLRGHFAPTAPIFAAFLANAVVMRTTGSSTIHGATAIINWLLFVAIIGLYFLQIDGPVVQ